MTTTDLRDRLDDELATIRPDRDLVHTARTAGARTLRRRRVAVAGIAAAAALTAGVVVAPSLLGGGSADTTVKDPQVATSAPPTNAAPDIRDVLADDLVTPTEWADVQVEAFDYLLPERFGAVTAAPLRGSESSDGAPTAFTLTTEAGSPRLRMGLGIQGPGGGKQPGESGCDGLRRVVADRGPELVEWTIVGCQDSVLGGGWRSMATVEYSRLSGEAQRVHGAAILTFTEGVWSEAGFHPVGSGPVTITAAELAAMSTDPLWLDLLEVGATYVRDRPVVPHSVVVPAPSLTAWPHAG